MLLSNHPQLAGGSHLPDITVITPVFSDAAGGGDAGGGGGGRRIVFFVASRGHHADIGGISPGSMPPTSKLLVEEGAAVVSFKLVRAGVYQVRRARRRAQMRKDCILLGAGAGRSVPRAEDRRGIYAFGLLDVMLDSAWGRCREESSSARDR